MSSFSLIVYAFYGRIEFSAIHFVEVVRNYSLCMKAEETVTNFAYCNAAGVIMKSARSTRAKMKMVIVDVRVIPARRGTVSHSQPFPTRYQD